MLTLFYCNISFQCPFCFLFLVNLTGYDPEQSDVASKLSVSEQELGLDDLHKFLPNGIILCSYEIPVSQIENKFSKSAASLGIVQSLKTSLLNFFLTITWCLNILHGYVPTNISFPRFVPVHSYVQRLSWHGIYDIQVKFMAKTVPWITFTQFFQAEKINFVTWEMHSSFTLEKSVLQVSWEEEGKRNL